MAAADRVTVRVVVEVDVDRVTWAHTYGDATGPDDLMRDLTLRAAVTDYVRGAVEVSGAVESGAITAVRY